MLCAFIYRWNVFCYTVPWVPINSMIQKHNPGCSFLLCLNLRAAPGLFSTAEVWIVAETVQTSTWRSIRQHPSASTGSAGSWLCLVERTEKRSVCITYSNTWSHLFIETYLCTFFGKSVIWFVSDFVLHIVCSSTSYCIASNTYYNN